jgi:membrane fusion protein, multidrug efflux system
MNIQTNKKKKVIVLLIVLLATGILLWSVQSIRALGEVSTDDAYIEGRIHSIASKVSGTVKKVYIDDNQRVAKGQLLLEIDPADYDLQASSARSALEAEKIRLNDAQSGIRVSRISLVQATLDKQRAERLLKDNVLPKERYEKIITAYKLAVEQLKAADSKRDLEKALVAGREVAFKTAELNLSYTKIFAPSDGNVANKSVESCNQIQAGQPLMAVVALDDIWITANYKETQLKKVRSGQRVKIKVDTYPGKTFAGKVDSIKVGTGAVFSLFPPENALGNYVKVVQRIPVKIVLDKAANDRYVLRIGMSCVPTIITRDE